MIERESVTVEQVEGILDRVRSWPIERKDAAWMLLMMEEKVWSLAN